jgi:hypothetical protein
VEPYVGQYGDDVKIVTGDFGLEGHLFLIASINVQVADLW